MGIALDRAETGCIVKVRDDIPMKLRGFQMAYSRLMSEAKLTVTVVPQYLDEHSHPERDEYAFAYAVTVTNTGDVPAQVIGRHWVITDANGKVEEVKGLGLVGKQPLIQPGAQFEYSSWTRLDTPHGIMHGEFYCVTEDMEFFETTIEPFALVRSQSLH